jgi:hypothetical protein
MNDINKSVSFNDNITIFEFYENETICKFNNNTNNTNNTNNNTNSNISCISLSKNLNPLNFYDDIIIIDLDADNRVKKHNIFYKVLKYMSRIFRALRFLNGTKKRQ